MRNIFLFAAIIYATYVPSLGAFFYSSNRMHVLGFIPHSINLSGVKSKLNKVEAWRLDYFNDYLSDRVVFSLVECEGESAIEDFEKLYKKTLRNIIFYTNLNSQYGTQIRIANKEKKQESKEHLTTNSKVGAAQLFSESGLEKSNRSLIYGHKNCRPVQDDYVSSGQIESIKKSIENRITKTIFDLIKEHQSYMQVGWQCLIWGSAAFEHYYGYEDYWTHMLKYWAIYVRLFFSAAPAAIQFYHAYWRPLAQQELGIVADNLAFMANIQVELLDNTRYDESLSLSALAPTSLRQTDYGWRYDRYILLKKLLSNLIKAGPESSVTIFKNIYHDEEPNYEQEQEHRIRDNFFDKNQSSGSSTHEFYASKPSDLRRLRGM